MSKPESQSNLQKWFSHTTVPFIANAPMYGFADAGLSTAVTQAGGFGFIGGGLDFSAQSTQHDTLETELTRARSLLGIGDQVKNPLPLGVGFITLRPDGFVENTIPILVRHRVAGICLAFPTAGTDHGPIISAIRDARQAESWDVKVFVQVGTVAAAREAVEQGADILIVQGGDSGGHQWAHAASVVALVPEVRDMLSELGKASEVAVVVAGGIVDGRGCAAALSLGGDGILMGTRFLATDECPVPEIIKNTLAATTDGAVSTIKSLKHDVFQSTDIWPPEYSGRAVIGRSYEDFENGLPDEENIKRYTQSRTEGDDGRRTVWAGAGLGVIKQVTSAGEIVKTTQHDARQILEKLRSTLQEE